MESTLRKKELIIISVLCPRLTLELFLKIAAGSMIPITELRATIPIFIAGNPEISIWLIFAAAVAGNMVPNFLILWFLPQLNNWLHNHLAPRINSTVLSWHDYFIKNDRLHLYYIGISLLTTGILGVMFLRGVTSFIWYGAVLLAIPIWGYIFFLVAHKAYQAAINEKSIIHWFYNKVRKEHSRKFYRWGSVALIVIVGIPLPGTGSWTGSILAFLFNIPFWKAIGLIFLGVIIAGLIVTGLSTGIINGLNFI